MSTYPIDPVGPVSELELAELEQSPGVSLPPIYRRVLAETDGGYANGETDLVLPAFDIIFLSLLGVTDEAPGDLVTQRREGSVIIPANLG